MVCMCCVTNMPAAPSASKSAGVQAGVLSSATSNASNLLLSLQSRLLRGVRPHQTQPTPSLHRAISSSSSAQRQSSLRQPGGSHRQEQQQEQEPSLCVQVLSIGHLQCSTGKQYVASPAGTAANSTVAAALGSAAAAALARTNAPVLAKVQDANFGGQLWWQHSRHTA